MPQRRDHVVRIQPPRVIYIDVGQSNHAFSIDEKCGRHGQVLRVIGAVEEIERMAAELAVKLLQFFSNLENDAKLPGHLIPHIAQHAVKPWFDGKVKFSPPVYDFAERGFRLTGGRLDYLNGREVAALVYQRKLHVINLFIWPSESGRNMGAESFTKDGYNVSHWDRDGFEFWAVSDVNADDLRAFAGLHIQPSSTRLQKGAKMHGRYQQTLTAALFS